MISNSQDNNNNNHKNQRKLNFPKINMHILLKGIQSLGVEKVWGKKERKTCFVNAAFSMKKKCNEIEEKKIPINEWLVIKFLEFFFQVNWIMIIQIFFLSISKTSKYSFIVTSDKNSAKLSKQIGK